LVILAVLTNITAFNRLREAKKALIKLEEEEGK
jgi:CDP-diacylglycerol--glycerol-3-phosphate 3-phosphatidyltransferase